MSTAAAQQTTQPTLGSFLKWGGAFGVYAIVVYAFDESEKYNAIVEALVWLVAVTAVFKWYKQIGLNLKTMTGVAL
jgi:hypothetical protein